LLRRTALSMIVKLSVFLDEWTRISSTEDVVGGIIIISGSGSGSSDGLDVVFGDEGTDGAAGGTDDGHGVFGDFTPLGEAEPFLGDYLALFRGHYTAFAAEIEGDYQADELVRVGLFAEYHSHRWRFRRPSSWPVLICSGSFRFGSIRDRDC
jgi:hypothetical protein